MVHGCALGSRDLLHRGSAGGTGLAPQGQKTALFSPPWLAVGTSLLLHRVFAGAGLLLAAVEGPLVRHGGHGVASRV